MIERNATKILSFLPTLILLAVCSCNGRRSSQSPDERPVPPNATLIRVNRGPLYSEQTGKIEPRDVSYVAPTKWGRLDWKIDELSDVKVGDVVLRLERTDREDQLENATKQLDSQNESILTKQNEISESQKTRTETMDVALSALKLAEMRYREASAAPDAKTIEKTLINLTLADDRATIARKEYDEARLLGSQGFAALAEIEQLEANARIADYGLNTSWRSSLAILSGRSDIDLTILGLRWRLAWLDLLTKHYNAQLREISLLSDIGVMFGARKWAAQSVRDIETWLTASTVTAPASGMVIYSKEWDGSDIDIGRNVGPGRVVLNIVDRKKMKVRTEIPERFVNDIHVGSVCEIYLEPNGLGRQFSGPTLWIDQWGRDKHAVPGASGEKRGLSGERVFNVEVNINDVDESVINPGRIVWVRFPVSSLADVVSVPRRAVETDSQGASVWIATGSTAVRRRIILADQDVNGLAVVLEGLAGGEMLLAPVTAGGQTE